MAKARHAFALRADFEDFSGGVIAVPGSEKDFDVGKALKDGKGRIETSDEQLADALRSYPALKTATDESKDSTGKGGSS